MYQTTLEDLAVRTEAGVISPEKLSTPKRIFDTVCKEVAIPPGAESERSNLAQKIINAANTTEEESLLLVFARRAAQNMRR